MALMIAAGFLIAPVVMAQEKIVMDMMKNGAVTAIGWIVQLWVSLIGKLCLMLVAIIIDLAQYNEFVTSAAVTNGWVIIRDVVNMFFILILLVIAFATIFNVKEYKYQAMLPRLLIMAVVINFSRTICGIFIDLGQVVMLTFVNGFQAAAGGNFVKALKIEELLKFDTTQAPPNLLNVVGSFILAAIMVTVTAVVLGAFAIMLVMRVVTLWFLVVLSPLAFMSSVWPSGRLKANYGKWWDMFLDNIMVGPIMAFFLWLSLLVLGNGDIATADNISKSSVAATYGQESAGGPNLNVANTQVGTLDNMISYLMGIGMLLGSLYMAQSMRAAGAGIAGKALGSIQGYAKAAVTKTAMAPVRATKWAGKKAAGAVYEKTGTRAFLAAAKIQVQNQPWAQKIGLGSKEHKQTENLKRDEKMAKAMGQEGRASAIRYKIIAEERKKIAEKDMTPMELRKKSDELLKGKQDTHEYEAYVREMAEKGGIKNNDDFKKYAGDNERLEEQLRTASYKAGNKMAFVDFKEPDKRKAAQHVLGAENLGGQQKILGGIKDAASKGVDGKPQNSIATDMLMAVDEKDFAKYGAAMQKEINDALLLAFENTDDVNLKAELQGKYDTLNNSGLAGAPGGTFAGATARRQELVEEQNVKLGTAQLASYRAGTLEKSDVDTGVEKMITDVGKTPALGGEQWQKDFMTDAYKVLNAVATTKNEAEARRNAQAIADLVSRLDDKAQDVDTTVGTHSGQFNEQGQELNHQQLVQESQIYKSLEGAYNMMVGTAQQAATTGQIDGKKKEAAASYANVAARYTEDATGKGTEIKKDKVRTVRDRFDPLQGVKTYKTLVKEYTTASVGASKKLDSASGTTDASKRIQQLGGALNQLENAIKLMQRNQERFSPAFITNMTSLRREIGTLRNMGASVGKAEIDSLKQMLELAKLE